LLAIASGRRTEGMDAEIDVKLVINKNKNIRKYRYRKKKMIRYPFKSLRNTEVSACGISLKLFMLPSVLTTYCDLVAISIIVVRIGPKGKRRQQVT
jgi:hypothetical protein